MVLIAILAYRQQQSMYIPLFLIGFGQGVAMPSLISQLVERVDVRWAGLAAGISNSALQLGGALAVAITGGVFFTITGETSSAITVSHAFSISCLMTGGGLAFAALLSLTRGWNEAGMSASKP